MKRWIVYRANIPNEQRVLDNIKKLVPEVFVLDCKCKNNDMDPELAQALFELIHTKKAELIFSVDYYPIIAEVAHTAGIRYISWIVDSPHYTLYSSSSFYDECFIFHFDREEAMLLKETGRPHIFHQPLASDPEYFHEVIQAKKGVQWKDISFLGSAYQDDHDYFEKNELDEYDRGYCEGLMQVQSVLYGVSFIEGTLTDVLAERLIKACNIRWPETYDLPPRLVAANVLEKKITVRERSQAVKELAKHYGITLYSESDVLVRENVDYCGYADYETEMPIAFHYSRINLNPTLRKIHSGIPLRAMDIMACGGFLLSNYQPELAESFEDGIACVMYGSIEELVDKAGWYLEHEEERAKIALRGYQIVCESFTYEKALRKIIKLVGE